MTLVAGTIVVIKEGMPSYLVVKDQKQVSFFSAKMHKHRNETALGTIIKAFEPYFVIDNLRLDELTSVRIQNEMCSLYVFEVVDFSLVKSQNDNFEFVEASSIHNLLETVDMNAAPKLL